MMNTYVHYDSTSVVAQEIVLEVIEPDPIVQQSLCTNRQVIYECRILVGSTGLTWTLPTSDTLGFSVASQVGNTRSSSDDKFSATLTRKTEDDGTDDFLLTSTLQIQPPLDSLNGQSLRCAGGTVENPVDVSTTITAISKYLHQLYVYVVIPFALPGGPKLNFHLYILVQCIYHLIYTSQLTHILLIPL